MALIEKIIAQINKERGVFFVCLAISALFWVLNRLQVQTERSLDIPISYSLPDEMAFEEAPKQNVQITFQANGWDVFFRPINNGINVALNSDSVQNIPLRYMASSQLSLNIINCEPESINLTLEEAAEKVVPITPVSLVSFANGYNLSDHIKLSPANVRVRGPKKLISELTDIKTDTIVIINLRGEQKVNVKLNNNPLLRYDIAQTTATLKAEQFTQKTIFAYLNLDGAPMKLRVFPDKIKIDCAVPLSKFNEVSASQFLLTVDFKLANTKEKNTNVPITLLKKSDFAQNIKLTPEAVEFYLEK